MSKRALVGWWLLLASSAARAQTAPLPEPVAASAIPEAPILVAVDRDDDDDDGVVDAEQASAVPLTNAAELVIAAGSGEPVTVQALGGLRVLRGGKPVALPFTLKPGELPTPLWLQATQPSLGSHSLALLLTEGSRMTRRSVHAVELALLNAQNKPLRPAADALSISQRVTSDASLPRTAEHALMSPDPLNVRVQITDSAATGKRVQARIEALDESGKSRHVLDLTLTREEVSQPFRSRFIRLVGDHVDRDARGVAGQALLVALRDRVRVSYETPNGRVTQEMRVSRPGDETGPLAARRVALRVSVLRAGRGGAPVIGIDDLSALRIVREEIESANEIWLQCHITFGPPSEVPVELVDPPTSGLIAVSNRDGLPARGGAVRLRIEGRLLPSVEIGAGSTATDTALRIADMLRAFGLDAQVTVNPKTVFGAAPSADIEVRKRDGSLAAIESVPGVPITSDPQQSIELGSVNLGDGVEEFDNMTAASGTLEERTLVKTLEDDDPATIDLFIINRFTLGTRQGEAFIEASAGPIANAVILDRTGLRHRETAWTMAHELGHVLMNQPLHPDNVGRDRPWLLMDSDNNRGTVNGPKRLTPEECALARHASGVEQAPAILLPFAERNHSK